MRFDKNYYVKIVWKESLTKNERDFINKNIEIWNVFLHNDGRYYSKDLENPKESLLWFTGIFDYKVIFDKAKQVIFHYGEFEDNVLEEIRTSRYQMFYNKNLNQ